MTLIDQNALVAPCLFPVVQTIVGGVISCGFGLKTACDVLEIVARKVHIIALTYQLGYMNIDSEKDYKKKDYTDATNRLSRKIEKLDDLKKDSISHLATAIFFLFCAVPLVGTAVSAVKLYMNSVAQRDYQIYDEA